MHFRALAGSSFHDKNRMKTIQLHFHSTQISPTAFRPGPGSQFSLPRDRFHGPTLPPPQDSRSRHGGDDQRPTGRARPSFRDLSRRFLQTEARRHFAAELAMFLIIVLLGAWTFPVVLTTIAQTIR